MSTNHVHHSQPPAAGGQAGRAVLMAAAMTALIGLFFLLREHWAHVGGYWVYLLLLACPLMHLFHGHGRHGAHHHHGSGSTDAKGR